MGGMREPCRGRLLGIDTCSDDNVWRETLETPNERRKSIGGSPLYGCNRANGLLIVEVLEDRALGILHYRRHQLKEPDVPSILE